MSPDPVTVRPDDTVETAATLMHDHDVSRLPVVEDGAPGRHHRPGDIVRAIVAEPPPEGGRPVACAPPGPRSTSAPSPTTWPPLAELAAPAEVCAVVKADGYGHGAVPVARAALAAGAAWLAVALVEEGATLREAGIDAPVLCSPRPARPSSPTWRPSTCGSPCTPRPGIAAAAATAAASRRPST